MWFLFGKVSSSSLCFGWAALFELISIVLCFSDDFVMASCPSNLYKARRQTDDQLLERANTHAVLHTVCTAENKVLEMMEMQGKHTSFVTRKLS